MPYINSQNIMAPQTPPPPYDDYDIIYGEDISPGYTPDDSSSFDDSNNGFFTSIMNRLSDAVSFLWRVLTFWKS